MNQRRYLTVSLPNPKPSVTLPRRVGEVLVHVRDSGPRGISSMALLELGCLNPTNAISALKKSGALIETELREVVDRRGENHPRVAHYAYYGWRSEPNCHNDTTTK
jgi:hypothetical protein